MTRRALGLSPALGGDADAHLGVLAAALDEERALIMHQKRNG
jgi:hypothetical protein